MTSWRQFNLDSQQKIAIRWRRHRVSRLVRWQSERDVRSPEASSTMASIAQTTDKSTLWAKG